MSEKKQKQDKPILDDNSSTSPGEIVEELSLEERVNDPKFLEQLAQQKKKVISVDELSAGLKDEFRLMVDTLSAFRETVIEKRQNIREKREFIKKKVDKLVELKQIHLNQQEYKRSEIGVINYERLLDGIIASVEFEVAYFSSFLNNKPPRLSVVNESDNSFAHFADERIKGTKRYLKTVAKDLQVSYSRYNYGFDEQLKRILYIETLMRGAKK